LTIKALRYSSAERGSALSSCSKDLRGEAREESTGGTVQCEYVEARRTSATKPMSLFQQLDTG